MAKILAAPTHPPTLTTRQIGQHYEQQARAYLEEVGLRFIAANVRFPQGEIDLIMQDGLTIVFVEVSYRHHTNFGGALETIPTQKQRRLRHSAMHWLIQQGKNPDNTPCRFDVLAITGRQQQWVTDAFGEK